MRTAEFIWAFLLATAFGYGLAHFISPRLREWRERMRWHRWPDHVPPNEEPLLIEVTNLAGGSSWNCSGHYSLAQKGFTLFAGDRAAPDAFVIAGWRQWPEPMRTRDERRER